MRPGENRGAWKECLALLPPGPDAVHTLPPPRLDDGTNALSLPRAVRRPAPPGGPANLPLTPPATPRASPADRSRRRGTPALAVLFQTAPCRSAPVHGSTG